MRALLAAAALGLLSTTSAGAGCLKLADSDVISVPHGYFVRSLKTFIRYEDALPSGDDHFWICTAARGPITLYAPRDPAEDNAD